jgi:hypothetical protein
MVWMCQVYVNQWKTCHHMYIQTNKYLRVKKKYRITEEDIQLIMQDSDTEWKVPSNE